MDEPSRLTKTKNSGRRPDVAVKNEKYFTKEMPGCHRDNISSKPGLCWTWDSNLTFP